jgi:hypothetical protein
VKALPVAAGYLTRDILPQYEVLDQKCFGAETKDPEGRQSLCDSATEILNLYAPDLDIYDAWYRKSNSSTQEKYYSNYLLDPEVVADLNLPVDHPPYHISNRSYSTIMARDRLVPSIPVIAEVLKEIPILFFDAEFDMLDGPVGVQQWLYTLLDFA